MEDAGSFETLMVVFLTVLRHILCQFNYRRDHLWKFTFHTLVSQTRVPLEN